MAVNLDESITTYFRGNSTSLVQEAEKAKKAVTSLQRAYTQRMDNVKGTILDPSSLVGRGVEKLAGSLKLSSLSAGVLGAGVTLAAAGFRKANEFAGQTADRLSGISEEMRRTSRVNLFATSADGVDSLADKLSTLRNQALEQRGALREADPYGFGGGVKGNMLTAFSDMQTSLKSSLGLGPYSNFDRQTDEKTMAEQRLRVNAQEQTKLRKNIEASSARTLEIDRAQISGGELQVSLLRTQLDLEKKIADARNKEIATPGILQDLEDNASLARRTAKLHHRSEYGDAVTRSLAASYGPGPLQELQRAQANRLGLDYQHRLALTRPGGMFKTEALDWKTRQREADLAINAAALEARKHLDSVAAVRLEIGAQRELVGLGQRGFEARKSMADLDVRAAEAAREQAYTMGDYVKANERVKEAVAARVALEKTSVLTQRASADLAFSLANRQADVNSTNASSLSKRAQANRLNVAAMQTEYALPGTSDERKRELLLGLRGAENERRTMLQERGFGKSGLQIQRALRKEANETRLRDLFDRKNAATDGLMNVSRDLNGRVTGGIDMLTGERRAPMAHLVRPDGHAASAGNSAMMQVQSKQLEAQQAMKAGIDKLVQSFQKLEVTWVGFA